MRKLYSPFFLTILVLSFLLLLLPTARKDVMVSYFSIMVANVFHELGHLIVGYLNGIKPSYLIVGFIKFDFENGFRVRFNDNWMYYGGIYRYKIANYPGKAVLSLLVGGPLISLFGSFALLFKIDFFTIFGNSSLLLFVATVIPVNSFGLCSDGFKIYKLLVKDELFLLWQKMSNQLLQDYNEMTFDDVSRICDTIECQVVPNYMINTFLLYLIYAWLLQGEMLQIRNSYQILTEIKPSNQFNRNYYYSLLVSLEALVYKRMSSDLFAKVNLEKLDKISQKRLQYLSCFYLENSEDISEKKIAFQEVLSSYSEQKSVLVQAEKQFLV
ncbi:site-2 protease family protein [Streptococcus ruminicola]|uniref:site-2 protease family protein n=2 Tax=Streptococcus ruminicola TaxID=2686210 RepID=UPI00157556DA|nr:site-2 protease family protein [Streptococcus ruminicola]